MAEGILSILIIVAIISGAIGMSLGGSVNKGAAGFWLGFFLGPIGWIIVLLLPRETSHIPRAQAQTQTPKERPPRDLTSNKYKIWLGKKYEINRNELFDQFECDGELFESLDDALKYADELEVDQRQRLEKARAASPPPSYEQIKTDLLEKTYEQIKTDLLEKNIWVRTRTWGGGYTAIDQDGEHRLKTDSDLREYYIKVFDSSND